MIYLFLLIFAFLSPVAYAADGWATHYQLVELDACYETPSAACSSAVGQPARAGDTNTFSYTRLRNGTECQHSNRSDFVGGETRPLSTCTYEPPPPNCQIKVGQRYITGDQSLPEGWEQSDEDGCYAACAYVLNRNIENDDPIQCTYTGDPALGPDANGDYENNPDPYDPSYCNVPGEYENTCLDWDHPSNEPDENEGCSSGTQYGVVDYGNGPVGVCAPSSGGADGFDYGSGVDTSVDQDGDGQPNSSDNDIDGDGIPNDADPDRDGDGVPNADDPNPDGNQGNGEGQDGTDSQSSEGEGPKGQASTCAKAPKSTGDPQLAAIHLQLWYNRCKGKKIDDVYNAIEKTNEALGKMTEEVGDTESDTLVGNVSTGAINDLDTFGDAHIADIGTGSEGGGPMAGIVEGSGVKSFFTSLVPQPQSCSALQLSFASKLSLPIPCEKFMLFKTWFGWALGIMTAYAIIMLALTPAPSKV